MVLLLGCREEPKETPTSGNLHIYVTESIAPILIRQINSFLSLYAQNGANITYTVVTSKEAKRHFLFDSSRIVFLPEQLTQEEKGKAKNIYGEINELIIGYDGIAVISNQKNKVEGITTSEIKNIITNKLSRWEQLKGNKGFRGKIKLYIQKDSDVTEFLEKRFQLPQINYANMDLTTTESEIETARLVKDNINGLGFIPISWLDSLKGDLKVLGIARTKEDTDTSFASASNVIGQYFIPHPAYLFKNYYPLKRAIYMYTQGGAGLTAGFASYVGSSEGQKLLLEQGVLPGTQPIKLKESPY